MAFNFSLPLAKRYTSKCGTVQSKLVRGVRREYTFEAQLKRKTKGGNWQNLGPIKVGLNIDFVPGNLGRRPTRFTSISMPNNPQLENELQKEFHVGKEFELLKPAPNDVARGLTFDIACTEYSSVVDNMCSRVEYSATSEIANASFLRSHGLDSAYSIEFSQELPKVDVFELLKQADPNFKKFVESGELPQNGLFRRLFG